MYMYYTPALLLSCICAHNATHFLFTRFDSHYGTYGETNKLYIYHTLTRISSSTNLLQIFYK